MKYFLNIFAQVAAYENENLIFANSFRWNLIEKLFFFSFQCVGLCHIDWKSCIGYGMYCLIEKTI